MSCRAESCLILPQPHSPPTLLAPLSLRLRVPSTAVAAACSSTADDENLSRLLGLLPPEERFFFFAGLQTGGGTACEHDASAAAGVQMWSSCLR
jgi:hypothetical protein